MRRGRCDVLTRWQVIKRRFKGLHQITELKTALGLRGRPLLVTEADGSHPWTGQDSTVAAHGRRQMFSSTLILY